MLGDNINNQEGRPLDYRVSVDKFKINFLDNFDIEKARKDALNGDISSMGCRSFCWRIFLGVIPDEQDPKKWVKSVKEKRETYKQATDKLKMIGKDTDLDPNLFNPLALGNKENPWTTFFKDAELKEVIKQDINRTYQEKEFFRMEEVKDQMLSVLFLWSRENAKISYRQGMNEILATIMIVFHTEKMHFEGDEDEDVNLKPHRLLSFLNDDKHLVADMYSVFEKVMSLGIQELFLPAESDSKDKGRKFEELFSWNFDTSMIRSAILSDSAKSLSPVMKRCYRIYNTFLKTVDRQLYDHLQREQIEPQLHLLRWLRCMLSREFHIEDVLMFWDAVFASIDVKSLTNENKSKAYDNSNFYTNDKDPLLLLDLICTAMTIYVRSYLLESDGMSCLQRLLKYPPVESPKLLIRMAIGYKDLLFKTNKGAAAVAQKEKTHEVQRPNDPLMSRLSEPTYQKERSGGFIHNPFQSQTSPYSANRQGDQFSFPYPDRKSEGKLETKPEIKPLNKEQHSTSDSPQREVKNIFDTKEKIQASPKSDTQLFFTRKEEAKSSASNPDKIKEIITKKLADTVCIFKGQRIRKHLDEDLITKGIADLEEIRELLQKL